MNSGRHFVNSLGMKMIFVEGAAFDAWIPSLGARAEAASAGKRSDQMFALNRPRVPSPAEVADCFIAEFPVTNGMYRQFVDATGHAAPHGKLLDGRGTRSGAPWEMEEFSGDDLPVTGVNDADVTAFCEWLSVKEGREYRPPTLREFEYANRAGTGTRFWWGDYPDTRHLNCGASQIGHPTPVGSYPPNPWGFYDMHGNVWEYCADAARFAAVGSAFNSPQRLTGADAWGNFAEGPRFMQLLSTGFRLACDAGEGDRRKRDLAAPSIVGAGGKGPNVPELDITVGDRIDMGPIEINAASLCVTREGAWILNRKRSTDQGRTWQECPCIGEAFRQLRDGTIVALPGPDSGGGPVTFADPLEGRGSMRVQISTDDWHSVETVDAPVHVPLGLQFNAVRGLLELEDGRLLATMYGHMDGDHVREESPVAFELSTPWIKTRVILIESADTAKTWQYLSTLSYHPELGTEGQNETDVIALPNGSLFAVMRTGIHGDVDPHGRTHLDQPLLAAWSTDRGRNWSEPERVYVDGKPITGIYPRALITGEGVLAVLRCRPDGSVIFSPDGNGASWSDEVTHYPISAPQKGVPYHAGMQDMALIGPNTILVADVVSKAGFPPEAGWHVEGVPITVKKKGFSSAQ